MLLQLKAANQIQTSLAQRKHRKAEGELKFSTE